MVFLGLKRPKTKRVGSQKPIGILKERSRASPMVTVLECIFIKTSLPLAIGLLTSMILRTSGPPYFVHATAFIYFYFLVTYINTNDIG
jgi:hypothetical protein